MDHKCNKEQIIEELKKITYKQDTKIAVLESKQNSFSDELKSLDIKIETISTKMEKEFKAINNKEIAILTFVAVTLIAVVLNIIGVKI